LEQLFKIKIFFLKKSKLFFFYIQRINNRILVFVVPIKFVAVQPIEWLCTCFDNGIFIIELDNDVKSIELANHLLNNHFFLSKLFFLKIFITEILVRDFHEKYNEMLRLNLLLMDDDFVIQYELLVYLNQYKNRYLV